MLPLLLWTCLAWQSPPPTTFPLTGIEVEGARWLSEALVLSEAGLHLDRAYQERELQAARNRIARLPFVLEVDFSLKKGTAYGTYTLVIGIVETMPLVFRMQYVSIETDRRRDDTLETEDIDRRSLDGVADWSLGARWFLGKHAMVYASTRLLWEDGNLDLADGSPVDFGFTHYHLLGRRMLLNLNFQWTDTVEGEVFDSRQRRSAAFRRDRPILPSLTLAAPIHGNHWLSLSADIFEEEQIYEGRRDRFLERITDKRQRARLGWFFDSSDDAVLPTSGRRIESGFTYNDSETAFDVVTPRPRPQPPVRRIENQRVLWSLSWREYHPFTARLSSFLNLDGEVRLHGEDVQIAVTENERVPNRLPFNQWQLTAGTRYDVLGTWQNGRYGELKLDFSASWAVANEERRTEETTELNLFLTWRNRWGLVRAGVTWQDITEDARRFVPPPPRDSAVEEARQ